MGEQYLGGYRGIAQGKVGNKRWRGVQKKIVFFSMQLPVSLIEDLKEGKIDSKRWKGGPRRRKNEIDLLNARAGIHWRLLERIKGWGGREAVGGAYSRRGGASGYHLRRKCW